MSADLSLLNPSRPTSATRGALTSGARVLLSDTLSAAWRGLVRIQRGIARPPRPRYQDELDLYLHERFGGHGRWSA
jgi:hypothetical protein